MSSGTDRLILYFCNCKEEAMREQVLFSQSGFYNISYFLHVFLYVFYKYKITKSCLSLVNEKKTGINCLKITHDFTLTDAIRINVFRHLKCYILMAFFM